MGKFSGLLLASDFDDTLFPTSALRARGERLETVPEATCAAARYFTAQGGLFTVSTGRSAATFAPFAAALPLNAPAIVSGGGALYDYAAGEYCLVTYLPPCAADDLAALAAAFPSAALELYHEDETVWVLHPNALSREHGRITRSVMRTAASLDAVSLPLHKALFEAPPPVLRALRAALEQTALGAQCEAVFAAPHMLELTARNADKGAMLLRLAARLGIETDGLCAAGDGDNDLPMLRAARFAFAPETAAPAVRALRGICLVCPPEQGALQEIVAHLERILSP